MAASATGSGHGKAIVIGEHHVMDGALALAIGLSGFRTDVRLTRCAPEQDALLLLWRGETLAAEVEADALRMLTCACERAGVLGAVTANVVSSVPIRRGLGSSAALAVAAVRAAWALADRAPPADADLLTMAREVESVVHGRSSGLDPAAACSTGGVLFQQGEVRARVQPAGASLSQARWVLLDLGAGAATRDAIATAIERRKTMSPEYLRSLGETTSSCARQAAAALAQDDLQALAAAMLRAGEALVPLGVVDERMAAVLAAAMNAGALAAKQTGAGLGGTLIALVANQTSAEQLVRALRPDIATAWVLPIVAEETHP